MRRILETIRCEESLLHFFRWAWPILEPGTPLIETRSFRAQVEHAQAWVDDEIDWLVVNVAPGDGKSHIWSRVVPVYWWLKTPFEWMLTGSHEMPLATSFLVDSRRIMSSPEFQERWADRVTFAPDQNAKTFYETIQGGRRQAVSVGGGIGKRGRIGILDDPQKDRQVRSPTESEACWVWVRRTFIPRLNDTPTRRSKLCLIMQRLGRGDITDHMLEEFGSRLDLLALQTRYVVHQVPAVPWGSPGFRHTPGSTCTTLSRAGRWTDERTVPGQILNPERTTPDAVSAKERDPVYFAAQEQQDPIDETSENRAIRGFTPETLVAFWTRFPGLTDRTSLPDITAAALQDGWYFGVSFDHGEKVGHEVACLNAFHDRLKREHVCDAYVNASRTTPLIDAIGVRLMLDRWGLAPGRCVLNRGDVNSGGKSSDVGSNINAQLSAARGDDLARYTGHPEYETAARRLGFLNWQAVVDRYGHVGFILGFPIGSPEKGGGSVQESVDLINTGLFGGTLLIDPLAVPVAASFSAWTGNDDQWKHAFDAVAYGLKEKLKEYLATGERWFAPPVRTFKR